MVTAYFVTIAYCIECGRDTLREADYGSQEAEEERLKDEGEMEQREERHRRKLFGGLTRSPWRLRGTCLVLWGCRDELG